MERRNFLMSSAAMVGAGAALKAVAAEKIHIATNTYPWGQFAKRRGEKFPLHTDASLAAIAATGLQGYEPVFLDAKEFDGLGARLNAHGLEMRSLYVNSTLHEADQADASIDSVLAIANEAAKLGTKIIVTNPSPIRWGGPENKTDAQLKVQAKALDRLGAELRKLGLMLAYHNHDIELRLGAREFHHMLTGTSPDNVKFCLDAHWVYRGCGNSVIALMDALAHYHDRVVELHLRQSEGGVWTEVFKMTGDIDYTRVFNYLAARNNQPHLVLEQAVESGSPNTTTVQAAHRQGRANLLRHYG